MFTPAHHLSISQVTLIQSMPPHSISLRSISILSSHLCLGVPSFLPPSDFSTKTPECNFFSSICATYFYHLILIETCGEQYNLLTLCSRATTKVAFSVTRFSARSRLSSFSHTSSCKCVCQQV